MSNASQKDIQSLAECVARTLQRSYRFAFAQLDQYLVIQQVSPDFVEIVDRSVSTPVGKPITDILWELVGSEPFLEEILRGERSNYRLEHINVTDDNGAQRYWTLQISPFDETISEDGLLLIIEDSSEYGRLHQYLVQERNELRLVRQELALANDELQRLSQLKSLFLSIAVHDLRSPLTSIRGFSELLLDEMEAGHQQEFLEIIVAQADRMQRLITDFLELDQLERGELAIDADYCDAVDIVLSVVQALNPVMDAKKQEIQLHLPSPPLLIWADSDQLSQVLYNLVGNAIKYSPEGSAIRVTIKRSKQLVIFEITDNGPGISKKDIGRLFNLYYRSEDALKSKVSGTGLGLYIVKMLVEAHGGQISVSSQPGQGTTFTVQLPADQEV